MHAVHHLHPCIKKCKLERSKQPKISKSGRPHGTWFFLFSVLCSLFAFFFARSSLLRAVPPSLDSIGAALLLPMVLWLVPYVTHCHTLALVGGFVKAQDRSAEWRSASAPLSECPLAHPPTTTTYMDVLSIMLARSSCVGRRYCTHRSSRPLLLYTHSTHPSFKPGANRARTWPPVVLKIGRGISVPTAYDHTPH